MSKLLVLTVVVAALLLSITAAAQEGAASELCSADESLSLDFWVGEWAVFDTGGEAIATSRVEVLNGNCLLRERRAHLDREIGTSTSYFDPTSGQWRQMWIFADGRILQLEGRAEDGGDLRFQGEAIGRNGLAQPARAALTYAAGAVRLVVEVAGSTADEWNVVEDLSFRRPESPGAVAAVEVTAPVATARPTAPAVEPVAAPAPRPEPLGDVTDELAVRSREVTGPKNRKLDATLESPMIFELKMGTLASFPPGYGWSSTQTAGYRCEGVSIRKVSATPKSGREKAEIELVVGLTGSRMTQRVGLTVELLAGGEVIASEQRSGISLGRLVTSNRDEGVPVKLSFELDRERFETVFGASSQPILRLILDCEG